MDPWTAVKGGASTVPKEIDEITEALELFAEHVKKAEIRGEVEHISDVNIVNKVIVHDWGKRLRTLFGKDTIDKITDKALSLQDVRRAGNEDVCATHKDRIRLNLGSPGTESSRADSVFGGSINQLANNPGSGGNGGKSLGDPSNDPNGIATGKFNRRDDREDRRANEFILVKASNVNINAFTGSNLIKSFYIPFSKSVRKLMFTQGQDGEELLKVMDHVESCSDDRFNNRHMKVLSEIYLKAYGYVRAVDAALLNWTDGVAQGLVEHGCENGLDAWRRFYNRYIPGAEDLQGLLMEELMNLKPVGEQEVDYFLQK